MQAGAGLGLSTDQICEIKRGGRSRSWRFPRHLKRELRIEACRWLECEGGGPNAAKRKASRGRGVKVSIAIFRGIRETSTRRISFSCFLVTSIRAQAAWIPSFLSPVSSLSASPQTFAHL